MLIHNLIDIVAKGGNYLLNVGPTVEGFIPEPSIERLKAIISHSGDLPKDLENAWVYRIELQK